MYISWITDGGLERRVLSTQIKGLVSFTKFPGKVSGVSPFFILQENELNYILSNKEAWEHCYDLYFKSLHEKSIAKKESE